MGLLDDAVYLRTCQDPRCSPHHRRPLPVEVGAQADLAVALVVGVGAGGVDEAAAKAVVAAEEEMDDGTGHGEPRMVERRGRHHQDLSLIHI